MDGSCGGAALERLNQSLLRLLTAGTANLRLLYAVVKRCRRDYHCTMDDGFEWVERWLDIWANDMRDPDLRLGAPSKSAGFAGGGWGENRNLAEDWEAEGNARAIGVVDAALRDAAPAETAAVFHVKLKSVFAFRVPVEIAYRNARMKCGVRLRANAFC